MSCFALALMVLSSAPAHASDPLRLTETFRVLKLSPYMRAAEDGGHIFSVQNAGTEQLELILHHLPQNGLAIALGLKSASFDILRLFSSDDREFAGAPGALEKLRFTVPSGQVQSFYLPGIEETLTPELYLWSPEALAAYESSRQTFHSAVLLLLFVLLFVALGVTLMRRSRRAVYAAVMAGGLMVLLGALWMRDVLPDNEQFQFLLVNRLDAIRVALGLGALMSLIAHLNLIVRQIPNRNYWTRVIIVSDIMLGAFLVFWVWEILTPDFAGLLSVELGEIALAMTCLTVLLGAVFVPDRPDSD